MFSKPNWVTEHIENENGFRAVSLFADSSWRNQAQTAWHHSDRDESTCSDRDCGRWERPFSLRLRRFEPYGDARKPASCVDGCYVFRLSRVGQPADSVPHQRSGVRLSRSIRATRPKKAEEKKSSSSRLDIVVEREFPWMRAQADRFRLETPFVIDKRLNQFFSKDIAFQQELVIIFEAAKRLFE